MKTPAMLAKKGGAVEAGAALIQKFFLFILFLVISIFLFIACFIKMLSSIVMLISLTLILSTSNKISDDLFFFLSHATSNESYSFGGILSAFFWISLIIFSFTALFSWLARSIENRFIKNIDQKESLCSSILDFIFYFIAW
jgi:hypothetical protein